MAFKPQVYDAKRFNVKASILIEGLSGKGKTGLALAIASILAGNDWTKVGLVDTENKSANLYEGNTLNTGVKVAPYKKIDLTESDGYAPLNYMACVEEFIKIGCVATILDSTTHAWLRTGGVLDLVNRLEAQGNRGGKFNAWGQPEVVANKNALFEMLRNDKIHTIATVRVKEKFSMDYDESGKSSVKSLGEQQQNQEGFKYEPDLVLHMDKPGSADSHPIVTVIKTRYPMFIQDDTIEMTPELITQIKDYLEEGADPTELLEQQRIDYINAIKTYVKANPTQKVIYDNLKKQQGYDNVKLDDITLDGVKTLYLMLTS